MNEMRKLMEAVDVSEEQINEASIDEKLSQRWSNVEESARRFYKNLEFFRSGYVEMSPHMSEDEEAHWGRVWDEIEHMMATMEDSLLLDE